MICRYPFPMSPNTNHYFQAFTFPGVWVCVHVCVCFRGVCVCAHAHTCVHTQAQAGFSHHRLKNKAFVCFEGKYIFRWETTRWQCSFKIHQVKVRHLQPHCVPASQNDKHVNKSLYIIQITVFFSNDKTFTNGTEHELWFSIFLFSLPLTWTCLWSTLFVPGTWNPYKIL